MPVNEIQWNLFSESKPKPGQKFIGASEKEWNTFTTPKHDVKDNNGKVEMTAEQQFDKIIEVYQLTKWIIPKI